MNNGPDLSILAKALKCGPNTPYAKLVEVAAGAVLRAENAEKQLQQLIDSIPNGTVLKS